MATFWSNCGPFRFYFGASYGSAQTALRRMEEPDVMLSYVTANNRPWDGIGNLFIDCGAFSIFKREGGYVTSARDYLEYVDEKGADKYALRDVPCNDKTLEITGQSVLQHQERTVEMHAECLALAREMGVDATPVTAVQGKTPEDYVRHLRMHADAGTLTWNVGIGSLAGRPIEEIEEIVSAVFGEVDHRVELHGYGVTERALESETLRHLLDTADSTKWSYGQYSDRLCKAERMFHTLTKKYLDAERLLQSLFATDDLEFHASESDVDQELAQEIIALEKADVNELVEHHFHEPDADEVVA